MLLEDGPELAGGEERGGGRGEIGEETGRGGEETFFNLETLGQ